MTSAILDTLRSGEVAICDHKGTMRPKKRIPPILKEIEKIWKQHPDLRLGQLLLNIVGESILYFMEDETLVDIIKKGYEKK